MKLIKCPKIQIQKNSENLLDNSRIDPTFYERQNYGTHTHTHTHTNTHTKQSNNNHTIHLCSNFICFIMNFVKRDSLKEFDYSVIFVMGAMHIKCTTESNVTRHFHNIMKYPSPTIVEL